MVNSNSPQQSEINLHFEATHVGVTEKSGDGEEPSQAEKAALALSASYMKEGVSYKAPVSDKARAVVGILTEIIENPGESSLRLILCDALEDFLTQKYHIEKIELLRSPSGWWTLESLSKENKLSGVRPFSRIESGKLYMNWHPWEDEEERRRQKNRDNAQYDASDLIDIRYPDGGLRYQVISVGVTTLQIHCSRCNREEVDIPYRCYTASKDTEHKWMCSDCLYDLRHLRNVATKFHAPIPYPQ